MVTSVILLLLGLGVPFGYYYLNRNPEFGGKIDNIVLADMRKSAHWKNDNFENISTTTMDVNLRSISGLIKERFQGRKLRDPKQVLPIVPFDAKYFGKGELPKFIWYGHSVLLLQINHVNILIDPMFGPDASPVGPLRTSRFSKNTLDIIGELPRIDAVLLTHDHYDHLDFHSMDMLKSKVDTFFVPLGVGRHLKRWGISGESITEFDWWQEHNIFGLNFVFTPSRHFSGRGPFDRSKSLWGGWIIGSDQHKLYWSGDGGYDAHFKAIGEKYGPFDWGFMECGQYNHRWHQIHMYPEEAVQAAIDARVTLAVPVHWGAFSLALHNWKDPIDRFVVAAQLKNQGYLTPKPGEIVIKGQIQVLPWWDDFD
jgi:L-ascorbate metabolism protein UlaG (beta-lactamase superfamily)